MSMSRAQRKLNRARGIALAAPFVAQFEGFRSSAYRDVVGVPTIGYGHTAGVRMGQRISRPAALALLAKDLYAYARPLRQLDLPLTPPMVAALVSFTYNLGPGVLAPDTGIGRDLRAHHWRKAANQMLRWDRAGGRRLEGLTRRRQAERKLFLSGT